jgi:methionine sulfoxide reductase catalytic subunit
MMHLYGMANLILRPDWHVPHKLVTPEKAFLNRRAFVKKMAAGTGLIAAATFGYPQSEAGKPAPAPLSPGKGFPALRNAQFNPGWRLTNEKIAGSYNNFYEFSLEKDQVRLLTGKFETAPWPIEIKGLVDKPLTLDAQELFELFPAEERVYRFRCVEAWAMIVPWTGFPLSKLIQKVSLKSEAKFIRFETFNRPEQAPGMGRLPRYPWPYFEGLRMEEAMNPLTLVVSGVYGKPLPKQHGAPVRLIVPWKYGYKSIKSIVKMECIAEQPKTFWETLSAEEYPFESNVNPKVPHPRWSQATERMIDTGDRVKTQLYNGYGNYVAKLYGKNEA